ncbi:sensor histidine kinase [Alkalihalobacillus sp. MEB130]|uniref:sensor histidine kinase n=1 Tax=Alkalihalobacillus sp. MEB130 TaxID=2976704 RepID=UPI0028E07BC3|nr:sensor histidine kinase [Alkalihalobacillus sp. MEB130]MDT8862439.1 sensor histidine kinase [Alkalihalobacillus sp. MEB130]
MSSIQDNNSRKYLTQPKTKLNLKMKMTFLIVLLIIGMFAIMGVFLQYFLSDTLEAQLGERALSVAESVAHIPELKEAFYLDEPAEVIQPLVAPIRKATKAEFIVVGNLQEIRYAHPIPEQIGRKMVGEDNDRALLHGESYVSKATGSLGQSIRGKVPVVSDQGEVIGVVSVGFLNDDVQSIIHHYSRELWLVLIAIVGVGVIGAIFIAHYIKKLLFGLEPEEISHLLLQKETILQSTHEGIIAVNKDGAITMINAAAKRLLRNRESKTEEFIGKPILDVLPTSKLHEVLEHGVSQYNKELLVGNDVVLVNRVPIYYQETLIGAVSTFRNKTEIENLTKELTRVSQYADALRAQTHEFSNKMYTILGLIQLERNDEAVDFIRRESNIQQKWIRLLVEKVSDPMVSAILLGKVNQANEQKVRLSIDPDSQLTHRLPNTERDALVTVLGNVIENAIDAVKMNPDSKREVSIFFTDLGDEILFEIEDSGQGVPSDMTLNIFNQGFSTKEGFHRGIGLALTKQVLKDIGGEILVEDGELGGACFVITIPKR